MEKINFVEYQTKVIEWLSSHILTMGFAVQSALIGISIISAFFIARSIMPKLNDLINNLKIPYKLTEVLYILLKVTVPFLAMAFIFIGSKIIGPAGFGFPITFATAVSKLMLAWIFIRLVSQFIEHRFARNVISFTVLGLAALSIFGVLDQTMTTLDAVGFNIGEFRLSALSVAKGILGIFVLMYA